MKLTILTAILVIGLCSASASLAGDSTYLEERSARLHQDIGDTSQTKSQQMTDTDRQTYRGSQSPRQQERWWK